MKYKALIILLFILGILIASTPLFYNIKEINDKVYVIGYLTSILATFLGVFLAVYITELNTTKKNKEKAIKMLQVSYEALRFYADYIKQLIALNNHRYLSKNRRPFPEVVNTLLTNPFVTENFSAETLFQIRNHYVNIEKALDIFFKIESSHNNSITKEGGWALFWVDKLIEVLSIEYSFQKQEISRKELKEKIKAHLEKINERMVIFNKEV